MTLSSKIRQTFHRNAAQAAPLKGGEETPAATSTEGPTILLPRVEQSVDFPSNTLALGFEDHGDDDESVDKTTTTKKSAKKSNPTSSVWLVDSLPV